MEKLDYLKKLISIKSFDTNENKEIIDYLYSEFSKSAKEVLIVKNDDGKRSNMLVGINTKLKDAKDAIILSGHVDTVVADEKSYLTSPYEGVEKEGKIFGLGSIDMKSFFANILGGIETLKKFKKPIIIAITGDEETDFNGVVKVTEKMRELGIKPLLSVIGEPTDSNICVSSRSQYVYAINIYGKSCHSSMPYNGINANYILANLILEIEKLCYKFEGTTTTCNVVSGGEKDNIISGYATMKFDIRSNNTKNVNCIVEAMNNKIQELLVKYDGAKIEMKNLLSVLPLEDKHSKLVKNLCERIEAEEKMFAGGCEAGHYQSLGGDAIVFGVGSLDLAHKPNEYAKIEEFDSYFDKLCKIIEYANEM